MDGMTLTAVTGSVLPTTVQLESKKRGFVNGENNNRSTHQSQRSQSPASFPKLSLSKPSWLVTTESNVRKAARKKADPPCIICKGSGRVDCHDCSGSGRTNCVHLVMLPRGEWPRWCKTCGGSGLGYCSRCLGTGEYRYVMGFHFMNRDDQHNGAP
ncbi:unnamed protein product [Linum trigynum]|uniref:Uncharacterized protein n=1 Tax=Linum trigynum TaxID=586398 RepID=A0AAV2ET04_9ROSI